VAIESVAPSLSKALCCRESKAVFTGTESVTIVVGFEDSRLPYKSLQYKSVSSHFKLKIRSLLSVWIHTLWRWVSPCAMSAWLLLVTLDALSNKVLAKLTTLECPYSIHKISNGMTYLLFPLMALSTTRTQFQSSLQKLIPSIILATSLHGFGHSKSLFVLSFFYRSSF
jgi:hypothetical protein